MSCHPILYRGAVRKSMANPSASSPTKPNRIDVHHHFIPDEYIQALKQTGGDPSGWHLPSWSLPESFEIMTALSTTTTIFSVTAPGPPILTGVPAATLARAINTHAAAITAANPSRYGFFAALPCLYKDLDLALSEMAYALDELKADGVTLYTRYGPGNHYLGHPDFRALWAELDKRRAVVFVHPTHAADTHLVNPALPQPMMDYPHETGRAAIDLIASDTLRAHPYVRVILSHAGGTLPYLADRVFSLLPDSGLLPAKTAEECWEDMRRFYYDVALSCNEFSLALLMKVAGPGRVLWGSDFPYAPRKTVEGMAGKFEGFRGWGFGEKEGVERGNAAGLFPRLRARGGGLMGDG